MNKPEMKRESVSHVPEHEVWLSFVNDEDACCFNDWWLTEGLGLFMEYAETAERF